MSYRRAPSPPQPPPHQCMSCLILYIFTSLLPSPVTSISKPFSSGLLVAAPSPCRRRTDLALPNVPVLATAAPLLIKKGPTCIFALGWFCALDALSPPSPPSPPSTGLTLPPPPRTPSTRRIGARGSLGSLGPLLGPKGFSVELWLPGHEPSKCELNVFFCLSLLYLAHIHHHRRQPEKLRQVILGGGISQKVLADPGQKAGSFSWCPGLEAVDLIRELR
jgi:hypothetical protein